MNREDGHVPQPRAPHGTPPGGQFTTRERAEADLTLDSPEASGSPWRIGWEQHPWKGPEERISATQRRKIAGPYWAAVPAEIADLRVDLEPDTIAEAADSTLAITHFDNDVTHALEHVRENESAEIAPLAAVLLRTESASSSQIENVTAGARQLALATIGERTGTNATLVARNVSALQTALALADRIDGQTILAMHDALLSQTDPDIAGKVREQQVWVGGGNHGPHGASFVPPHHTRVQAALDDLWRFCDRTDIPPLTQAAIAHAQFETIHPFADGNGRVGRALVHAMLRRAGVTRRMTVPTSAGLLVDVRSYFDALGRYREGNLGAITRQFSWAANSAVANGRQMVDELVAARARWHDEIEARKDAAVWRLTDLVIRQPAVTVNAVRENLAVAQSVAQNAIDQLEAVGALRKINSYKRNRVWESPEVLSALDDFAVRAGRRGVA